METIKAIVLDLDGTLLNSKKLVSSRNLEAILKCYSKDINIIIATARPPRSVKSLLPHELLRLGYIICYNGALIVNESTGLLEHCPVPNKIANEIYEFVSSRDNRIYLCFEIKNEIFSDRRLEKAQLNVFGIPDNAPIPSVLSKEEISNLSVSKILIPNINNIYLEFNTIFQQKVNIVNTDGKELIQIMNKSVSKENALQKVLKLLCISPRDTMVFGDDFNDLGLFDICGYPIAMGNAVDELKSRAMIITETNDEDGVAEILERILRTQ
ncbi:Cof-type HAD-IIB family hydrolase [Bacillus niameyensis]|uniref:Cof-type HAD-IIB family hydrolase n=1 Tax=Bacillus niameyensis TaxID=1522308 RepID=UPI0007828C2F|nr:Cof-type HAD-IIB family hydrolase [Bacillus niameyensis]